MVPQNRFWLVPNCEWSIVCSEVSGKCLWGELNKLTEPETAVEKRWPSDEVCSANRLVVILAQNGEDTFTILLTDIKLGKLNKMITD